MAFEVEVFEEDRGQWPAVCALLDQVSMGGAMQVAIQRSVERARSYLNLGGHHVDVLLRKDGALVGFARGRVERRQLWDGARLAPGLIALGGDLRIAPAARGTGALRALFDAIRDHGVSRGWYQGFGLINEGNDKIYGLMTAERHGQTSKLLRTFTTASVMLWRRPPRPKAPPLEAFTPSDAELEAIPRALAHRLFAPAPEAGVMTAVRATFPEMKFFRSTRDGAFVTALWNPARARQLRLHGLSPALRAVRLLWNGARPLTGAQPFPAAGEVVQSVELAFTVRERLDAAALAQLAHEAHALGGHVLNVVTQGLAEGEVLKAPGLATSLRTRLLSFAHAGRPLVEGPADLPAYLDLAIL